MGERILQKQSPQDESGLQNTDGRQVCKSSPVTHEEVAHDGREEVVHHHFHLADPRYKQRRHQIVKLEREVYLEEQPRSEGRWGD